MDFKDLQLTDGDACFYLRHLQWDSAFFGRPSYLLMCDRSRLLPSEKVCGEIRSALRHAFVSAKLDTVIDYRVSDFLQQCGFKYIDTEVQLELHRRLPSAKVPDIEIVRLDSNTGLPYEQLGSSFMHTRFHTDPHIGTVKADGVWVEYLKNFAPGAQKRMYVAKDGKDVIGTILVTLDGNVATLFFVAVIAAYRSKGIGKALIVKAIDDLKDYTIRTETQVQNISALNFYLQNGFIVKKVFSVLHRWEDD